MGSDFVSEGAAVAVSRDIAKKKKTHRSAKLKQCKLDARREQWLSQGLCSRSAVKNKDCVVSASRSPASSPPPHPALSKKMDIGLKEEEEEEEIRVSTERDGSISHDSERGSPTHGGNANGCPADSVSSGSSFASSSRSLSDAEVEADDHDHEERGEEGVDDWETLADELADDHSQPDQNPIATLPDSTAELGRTNKGNKSLEKPEAKQAVNRAWRPDDTLRPQSLPNLSKQRSFPVSMARRRPASGWAQRDILSTPSCPICCEDLDPTDSSFLPCNCGFRLCLFCHKRILEADGRCPGCRKHYAPVAGGEVGIMGEISTLALRLSRSCSMSSRT